MRNIFARPTLSANPPITTTKMPENNAANDTAVFIEFEEMPKSLPITEAILIMELAKSQKVSTDNINPNKILSFP